MALSVKVNYTDTPVSGAQAPEITIPVLNYSDDFRIDTNRPSEAILANITSPLGKPEKIRYAASDVSNVYSGTDVDRALWAPTLKGVSILAQLVDTYTVVDSADPTFEMALPMECHLVVKVPANELITADMVETFIGRLLATLFETGDTGTTRLKALLRKSLVPKGL